MSAQVNNWSDAFGRLIDGISSVGVAYLEADQAQEIPDFAAAQAAQQAQQQQAAASQASQSQNLLILGGVAVVVFMLMRSA